MPPPSASPPTPTSRVSPEVMTSPCGASASATSPQVAPLPTRTVPSGCTSMESKPRMSITRPSGLGKAFAPWPPLRTETGRSCSLGEAEGVGDLARGRGAHDRGGVADPVVGWGAAPRSRRRRAAGSRRRWRHGAWSGRSCGGPPEECGQRRQCVRHRAGSGADVTARRPSPRIPRPAGRPRARRRPRGSAASGRTRGRDARCPAARPRPPRARHPGAARSARAGRRARRPVRPDRARPSPVPSTTGRS